jgi:hypothetical protein
MNFVNAVAKTKQAMLENEQKSTAEFSEEDAVTAGIFISIVIDATDEFIKQQQVNFQNPMLGITIAPIQPNLTYDDIVIKAYNELVLSKTANTFAFLGSQQGKGGNQGTPKTTKLYRVMSEGEYESLMSNRQFTEYDRAMDSKWFATNTKDAVEWGKAFYPDGNYKIVEIEVPTDSLRQMYFVEKLDNIGPAYCAERDLINSIIQSIKEVLR